MGTHARRHEGGREAMIACPGCGTLVDIPTLPPRSEAVCRRCSAVLEKTSGRSVAAALACSLSTFLLLFPANLLPLLRMDMFGMHSQTLIAVGVWELFSRGWMFLATLTGLSVVLLPFVRFGLLSAVLSAVQFGHRPKWLGPVFRWAIWLDTWAMLDVFLLASFVGYYRLANVGQAHLMVAAGGQCFIAAAILTMLSRVTLDKRTVWRAIGGEMKTQPHARAIACTTCDLVQPLAREGGGCPRCGARLHIRKPGAMRMTAALVLTAFVLFFPANIYPMNVSSQLGERVPYTIFTGIHMLFIHGLWPLGVLISCTSILIPAAKIIVIGWCLISIRYRLARHLVARAKWFRVTAEISRWSNTDPFIIVFFVPLMNFGALASSTAGWGATAFLAMTYLTMSASTAFDPRLMWDAAGVPHR